MGTCGVVDIVRCRFRPTVVSVLAACQYVSVMVVPEVGGTVLARWCQIPECWQPSFGLGGHQEHVVRGRCQLSLASSPLLAYTPHLQL